MFVFFSHDKLEKHCISDNVIGSQKNWIALFAVCWKGMPRHECVYRIESYQNDEQNVTFDATDGVMAKTLYCPLSRYDILRSFIKYSI